MRGHSTPSIRDFQILAREHATTGRTLQFGQCTQSQRSARGCEDADRPAGRPLEELDDDGRYSNSTGRARTDAAWA